MDRRDFLRAAAGGVALTSGVRGKAINKLPGRRLLERRRARTPVKHLVVVMMENRSVDHYLGWYAKENPSFDGRQHLTVPDLRAGGKPISTEAWGAKGRKNFHGRGYDDPSHSWTGGRAEFNRGKVDGWLDPKTGNDEFCLAYYDDVDVPVWAQYMRDYQTYDRWFCSLMGPTEPNRYYLHSGQSGGHKTNITPPESFQDHPEWRTGWNWKTMWDLYDDHDVDGFYYFANLPDLAYWGGRHVNRMRHISGFYEACQNGTLPQVSILCPFVTIDDFGNDDHPHADMRLGQAFLSDVTEAFVHSRYYEKGALVVTYDEWGGFFDHVAPPRIDDRRGTPNDPGGVDDFSQLGFRIPSTIVSPWTRKSGTVDHTVYDHTSIAKFIADNWGLPYLTSRMRATNSIGNAFGGFRSFSPEPVFAPYTEPDGVARRAAVDTVNHRIHDAATDPFHLPVIGDIPFTPEWPLPPLPVPDKPVPGGTKGKPATKAAPRDPSGVERLRDMGWMDKWKIRTDWKFEDSYMRSRPQLKTLR